MSPSTTFRTSSERLHLHWVTFDALFEQMSGSELAAAIRWLRRLDGTRETVGQSSRWRVWTRHRGHAPR